jgi:hypothetical protein
MASTDGRMEEEIRNILASGEEATRGWSDQHVIAEATRRIGGTMDAIDGAAMHRWKAMIAQLRSATDNDGQTRA